MTEENITDYAIYDGTGKITCTVRCLPSDAGIQWIPEGGGIMESKGQTWETHHVHEGKVRSMGTRPSAAHQFDYNSKSWKDPRTLDDLKVTKWSEIKKERDALEFGGFLWNGNLFDSTPVSQQRIAHAAQAALIAQATGIAFTRDWTLADNTQVLLDANQMLAVATALDDHIAMTHTRSQYLRGKVESSGSARSIKTIDWNAGT